MQACKITAAIFLPVFAAGQQEPIAVLEAARGCGANFNFIRLAQELCFGAEVSYQSPSSKSDIKPALKAVQAWDVSLDQRLHPVRLLVLVTLIQIGGMGCHRLLASPFQWVASMPSLGGQILLYPLK